MLKSFEIVVTAPTMEKTEEEIAYFTRVFLQEAGGGPWECMEESVVPDPAWVPGRGFYGNIRGYKGRRSFTNREAGESAEENAKEGIQQGSEKSSSGDEEEVRGEKGH